MKREYTIRLTGVEAVGHHGVLPQERRDGQRFVVDVELGLERDRSDDLTGTVNYAEVAAAVVRDVERDPLDLIESLADRIADTLLRLAGVDWLRVTVHKPQAPVGVPFGDVAVSVTRERPDPVVLSLGSNQGHPLATLTEAVARLAASDGFTLRAVSPVYRTAPVGGVEQPDFLNVVVLGDTEALAEELLEDTQGIETALGRVRDVRWGPRTLDIDIIDVAGRLDDDENLTLPHPRAHERAFVLVPWLDVDPDAVLPGHGRVADLVAGLDAGGVRRLDDVRIVLP